MIDFLSQFGYGVVILGAMVYIVVIVYWTLHREGKND